MLSVTSRFSSHGAAAIAACASPAIPLVSRSAIVPVSWTPCRQASISFRDISQLSPEIQRAVLQAKACALINQGDKGGLQQLLTDRNDPLPKDYLSLEVLRCAILKRKEVGLGPLVSLIKSESLSSDYKTKLVWDAISDNLIPEGDVSTIKVLLSHLTDAEKSHSKSTDALKKAIKKGDLEIIQCLVKEAGVDPNKCISFSIKKDRDSKDWISLFEFAVLLGNPAVVKALVESGKVLPYSPKESLYATAPLVHAALPIPINRSLYSRYPEERDTPEGTEERDTPKGTIEEGYREYQFANREEIVKFLLKTYGVLRLGGEWNCAADKDPNDWKYGVAAEYICKHAKFCNMPRIVEYLEMLEHLGPEGKGSKTKA